MPTLAEVIGANLRQLRVAEGRTQDDVARAARACGLTWGRSSVAQVEDGSKALTAVELLVLPMVVHRSLGVDASLDELLTSFSDGDLGDVAEVDLREGVTLRTSAVQVLLKGGRPSLVADGLSTPGSREAEAAAGETRKRRRKLVSGGDASLDETRRAQADVGDEAVQKLARAMDRPALDVAVRARRLWGRSLVEERAARIGEAPATAQKLGHVTRQLRRELEESFGEGD